MPGLFERRKRLCVCPIFNDENVVRGFMSLFHANKPVVVKVHGFCVAGGTDMALCSDLMVIGEDAKIGYPPARVWGAPTTAVWAFRIGIEKTKRLMFTGDCLNGREVVDWGLATECAPADKLDEPFGDFGPSTFKG